MKVVKFGGSSLANGTQLQKVKNIVEADPKRRVVVVSAPGKRDASDTKVTDLLIEIAEKALRNEDYSLALRTVIQRYQDIVDELKMNPDVMEEIKANLYDLISSNKDESAYFIDALKASGEDNNARLVAAFFNQEGIPARYMNPKEAGLFVTDDPSNAQVLSESFVNLYRLHDYKEVLVFPGFFGYSKENRPVTFSRGGSDISGAIVANGVKASLYENFTDVDAIATVNPNLIKNPKEISHLTYREMRELSYAGFAVLHDEALQPAFTAGIPVVIKNTNNPSAPGTLISESRDIEAGPAVSGIAATDNFCSIFISKYLMNREIGFTRRALEIIEAYGLSYEHMPSGIDTIEIIMKDGQITEDKMAKLLEELRHQLGAESVSLQKNLSLIMIVGEGMSEKPGVAAAATKAFADAGINIEMINQGSSEYSMMFGIASDREDEAVKALYKAFYEEDQGK